MKRKKILGILRAAVYVGFLLILLVCFQSQLNKKVEANQYRINDNWLVSVNGKENFQNDLATFQLDYSKKGDVISISRKLEEKKLFLDTAVSVLVRYSQLRAFVDDTLIYEKNVDEYKAGNLLGNGYVWFSLPADYYGKNLRLEFTLGEDNSFTSFSDICLISATEGTAILLANNVLAIFVLSAFFALGSLAVIGSVIMVLHDERFKMLFHLGMFSIFSSVWLICNTRLLGLFTDNFTFIGTLEYIGLYGAFVAMVLFLAAMVKNETLKNILYIMGQCLVIGLCSLMVLNYYNILHFNRSVHYFQGFAIVSIFLIAFLLLKNVKEKDSKPEKYIILGMFMFLIFALLELVRYRYNRMTAPAYQFKQTIVPLGVAAFIICMFISFVHTIMEQVAENIEKEKLYDMAYYDSLTGLRNRAWCERIMRSFEMTNQPVTIINFDLDKFKQVNDTYGHKYGDDLLKEFGKCLSSNFPGADCVGRMGGDEFIVILDYMERQMIQEKIENLSEEIASINEKRKDAQIHFSVGVADNFEQPDLSIWKVYEKSDHSMYDNKNMKQVNV